MSMIFLRAAGAIAIAAAAAGHLAAEPATRLTGKAAAPNSECPPETARDPAAVEAAAGDPAAIAAIPCVRSEIKPAATGELDSSKLSPAARAALKPATKVAPPVVLPAPVVPPK